MTAFNTPEGIRLAPSTSSRRVLRGLATVVMREGSASIREIGREAGLSAPSTVMHHLRKLIAGGYVEEPVPGRPRDWRPTYEGWLAVDQS